MAVRLRQRLEALPPRAVALGVRLVLIGVGAAVDVARPGGLKYTDVDYDVLRDGAALMAVGASPFGRVTFRYSPVLAVPLLGDIWLGGAPFGKVFFAVADVALGEALERRLAGTALGAAGARTAALFGWHLNPLPIALCTRGSGDCVFAALVAAALVAAATNGSGSGARAGALVGLAAHARLYPVIYAPTFTLWFLCRRDRRAARAFCAAFSAGAALPTYLCYRSYGAAYVDGALLYHVGRADHRHNFSLFWLPIYLVGSLPAGGARRSLEACLALAPFAAHAVAQTAVLVGLRRDLDLALFAQTFLFVAFNKVVTAQYFCWWLPFFLLAAAPVADRFEARAVLLWAAAAAAWLGVAYRLEFAGDSSHDLLFGCSVAFFAAGVFLLEAVLRAARPPEAEKGA